MEENEENVVEEIVNETVSQEPKVETPEKETPKENVTKVDLKKFKSEEVESDVYKVDLSKPPTTNENTESTDTNETSDVQEETVEEKLNKETTAEQATEEGVEKPVVEEITQEDEEKANKIANEAEQAITESQQTGNPLPEGVQKLVDFMNDTGGDLVDYIKLTKDYDKLGDKALLTEYYRQTKSHLDDEEINFLMEDQFSFDEDMDDERDIRRKKLALKEQVANAKSQLDRLKSKYYHEIKAGSKLTPEQQKAVNFFDRYKKTTQESKQQSEVLVNNFNKKTNEFFGDKFKGFEYNVGDRRFRFNVSDTNKVKETHSDVQNFMGKFLNKNGALEDAAGYHKSLFTAMNSDAIAKHFYEQGKADAMKDSIAKSKNISMDPRQSHGEKQNTGGPKFRVLGDDSASFKWKIKNKN